MNRLLEEAPAPTLWTINDARTVDPAVLRRMMFALELRLPPPKVRARVWTRQLARHGIEAEPDDAFALAREFEATPGVAAGATAAARLGGGDLAAVRRGVRSLSRVLSCEKPPQETSARYDPALLRADTDPVRLADRLASSDERRFSLCLQGPPGHGQERVRALPCRAPRPGGRAEAGVGSDVEVGRGDRATDRRRVRGGARQRRLPRLRRGRFAARRPALRQEELGGQPGERDADLDGEPSRAVCLHDQLRCASRPGDAAAFRVQGHARLPHARAGGGRRSGATSGSRPRCSSRPSPP